VPLPSVNIVTNKFSVKERWLKLYRKIHNLFLKDEFVHVVDYKTMLEQLNLRMSLIEANMVAGDAAVTAATTAAIGTLSAGIAAQTAALEAGSATHIHNAPQAPAGILPTTPAVPPPLPLPPSVPPTLPAPPAPTTPKVPYTGVALKAADITLQATGPAVAPLGDGVAAETQAASLQISADIGT